MGIPQRATSRDFIANVRGISKEAYIEEYLVGRLAISPHRPYATKSSFDEYLDIWSRPRSLVYSQFQRDSSLASPPTAIPLTRLADMPLPYVEELPHFLMKGAYGFYPLVDGEHIEGVDHLYLNDDWAGLARGTFFFRRSSNLADLYLALPDVRWDLETGQLLPSVLCRPPAASTASNILTTPTLAAAAVAPDEARDLAVSITSTSLEIISTLSWATPAGPYVSAGVIIIEAIIGALVPTTDTLGLRLDALATRIVTSLTQFIESQQLKDNLKALSAFAQWLRKTNDELNTQDPTAFRSALLQPNGILSELNAQINDNAPEKLFALVTGLSNEPDLGPPTSDNDKGYESKQRWLLAQNKLAVLGYAITMYIVALKLKVALLSRLNLYGYNALNEKSDPEVNSDGTFVILRDEVLRLKAVIEARTKNVMARRLQMIGFRSADCEAAYSIEKRSSSDRATWDLGEHDGLYTGTYTDQRVRDLQDNPTKEEFESSWTPASDKGPPHQFMNSHWWKRHELIDYGHDDGQATLGYVLDNCQYGGWGYVADDARLKRLRDRYVGEIVAQLQPLSKIPTELEKSFENLLPRWTPQIPEHLPDGRLYIAQWHGSPLADELWADKQIEVRYQFRLVSVAHRGSPLSSDENSTAWERVCARDGGSTIEHGRHAPEIKGIPTTGDFLEYVIGIDLYRQFRKAGKVSAPRLVAKIARDETTGEFKVDSWIDQRSAENDKTAFKPTDSWVPKIPADLPKRLAIGEWHGKAEAGTLWAEPDVEVRYIYRIEALNGKLSEVSSDAVSSDWVRAGGQCEPEIINLPAGEGFMEFVNALHVYRQFRKGSKQSAARQVKKLARGEISGSFDKAFRDTESAQDDHLV
ncbi:hypothetical protein [Paraburkholderia caribensis]|uniref:hypothetical protein n=1 Tax=Paraburkholderia caribensis TaxID=75105 RepID=UPI0015903D02|nr:hypothetical protein [Paraburkholderia caribensis]